MSENRASESTQRREIEDRFINEWGLLANAWGVSPLLGRIHGLLLLMGRPMTAEEVCERLDISRASASVQLNAILGWGLARRMYLPATAASTTSPNPNRGRGSAARCACAKSANSIR